jgi:hypothetical protein
VTVGFCRYCGKVRQLCDSHALPVGIFRPILSASSGKLVGIPADDGPVHYTSDTGAAKLLCRDCETHFNKNWDAPTVNFLKRLDRAIIESGHTTQLPFPNAQLAHAIVSIVWRTCVSSAFMYAEVRPTTKDLAVVEAILRGPTSEVLRLCSVRIARLYDPTPEQKGGFGQEIMYQFILSPRLYRVKIKKNDKRLGFAFLFTMLGFAISLIFPKVPYPKRKKAGYLSISGDHVVAPPEDLMSIPPIVDALVDGLRKDIAGNVTQSVRKG